MDIEIGSFGKVCVEIAILAVPRAAADKGQLPVGRGLAALKFPTSPKGNYQSSFALEKFVPD
jgi:hypothetical protein